MKQLHSPCQDIAVTEVARKATCVQEKMTAFLVEVQQTHHSGRYPAALIGNMDEILVYFDLIPNRTIDTVGAKSCLVRSTGSEKRHITVVLTIAAND